MNYKCPVCRYPSMTEPPANYVICPCCGIEFGNDDDSHSHAQLRKIWIRDGMQFFSREPKGWDPLEQLHPGDLKLCSTKS